MYWITRIRVRKGVPPSTFIREAVTRGEVLDLIEPKRRSSVGDESLPFGHESLNQTRTVADVLQRTYSRQRFEVTEVQ